MDKYLKKTVLLASIIITCLSNAMCSYAFTEKESPAYTNVGDYSINNEAGVNPMPYYNYNGHLNCHFYTWGRVYETNGIPMSASVRDWYNNNVIYSEPRANSIAIWGTPGSLKHSAYVESVDGNNITISEGGNINTCGYNYQTVPLDLLRTGWSDVSLSGFIYLDGNAVANVQTPQNMTVKTTSVDGITQSNAVVRGEVGYSGSRPSEYGVYLGTSESNMQIVATDPCPNFSMNPYPTWYDLNKEANLTLSPGTTYYWSCYAVQNGAEVRGDNKSFRTLESNDSLSVTTGEVDNITGTNAMVHGNVSYNGNKPSEYGLYLGTSRSNLNKAATDPSPTFNMNPYPTWYDINVEAGMTLEPGKTYYYCCYAIQNGQEIKGDIKSFKTIN